MVSMGLMKKASNSSPNCPTEDSRERDENGGERKLVGFGKPLHRVEKEFVQVPFEEELSFVQNFST